MDLPSSQNAQQGSPRDVCATKSESAETASHLRRLQELLLSFGVESLADQANSAAEKLTEQRFYVACVGQFKRGKSTLLNSLLGEPLLPTGITPVTAIPTVVRYGKAAALRVRLQSGSWQLHEIEELPDFVAEERNPGNCRGVVGVEVFCAHPLLANGMCFVDTPGLGSVFELNTVSTRSFVPQIDAALVVLGGDPPISGDELKLIEEMSEFVPDLIFALNKSDRMNDSDRAEALSFTEKTLQDRLRRSVPICEVSSVRPMSFDWDRLVGDLQHLSERASQRIVAAAGSRAVTRLSKATLDLVQQDRENLLRPFPESEKKMNELQTIAAGAEQSIGDLVPLWDAAERAFLAGLTRRRAAFLDGVRPTAQEQLSRCCRHTRGTGLARRDCYLGCAQRIARDLVEPWLKQEEEWANAQYLATAKRFGQLSQDLLLRVENLSVMPSVLQEDIHIDPLGTTRRRFHFHELETLARPASPFRNLRDFLLLIFQQDHRIQQDASALLDHLIETNASRVEADVRERIAECRRVLQSALLKSIHLTARLARESLQRAQCAHAKGLTVVNQRLAELSKIEDEVQSWAGPPSRADGVNGTLPTWR
jgi:GTP-binding protein EngB required for normal cell division